MRERFRFSRRQALDRWHEERRRTVSCICASATTVILENGTIRTLDDSLPLARALAIASERISGGVGTHELALPTPDRIDLKGRCVVPGFVDAHVHFPSWAVAQGQLVLDGCRSLDEMLERVRAAALDLAPGQWLLGRGWRSPRLPSTRPIRALLDRAAPDRPVALTSKDGHSLWLNSPALDRAGDLSSEGGIIETADDGAPSGVLREGPAWRFLETHVNLTASEVRAAMREAFRTASARGVTGVHDKDGAEGALGHWQALHAEARLPLRVWQSLPHSRLELLSELEIAPGFGDGFLRVGYLKAFLDGALGSGTAHLLDGSGVALMEPAELAQLVRQAASRGWPVAVHAIGDQANRDALDALEATRDAWAPRGIRPRVEHAQLVSRDDLHRFAALGVACSVQFSHAPSDRDLVDEQWSDRLEGAYAYRSLWEADALLANGSDAPLEELDPLAGIRAAVLRTADDRPGWRMHEALTVEHALVASTRNPVWLEGAERTRGRLVPGALADLVVLSADPLAVEPHQLVDVEVVATMVGGRWVHNPPPWD
ncbi:MAG: amidohydrolase [Actinomycetia bacterium]|nr:amidohydrolase [Actinomycetes bacterium]